MARIQWAMTYGFGSFHMKPETPSEPFKRAVAVAVRSLAGEPELEVNFSSEPPSLKGLKARLPIAAPQSAGP